MSGSYLRTKRNIELSTIYYLKTQIDANWSNVTTLLSFKEADEASIPVVTVELGETISSGKEIGSTTLRQEFSIIVDVFAKSDAQRLDLADFILDKLSDGYTYYTHSQDSNYDYVRSSAGYVTLTRVLSDNKIDYYETVNSKEKYRHQMVVVVRHNQ